MNRRDFVKFGLGGAGLAAGGGFVSRNEQKPSSTFSKKFGHPWWVKEIDKPKLTVCPWTKKDKTMIHDIVKATSAKIPVCGNKNKGKTVLYLDFASNLACLVVFLGRGGHWIKTGAGTQSLQYFHVDILGESDYRFILMV